MSAVILPEECGVVPASTQQLGRFGGGVVLVGYRRLTMSGLRASWGAAGRYGALIDTK